MNQHRWVVAVAAIVVGLWGSVCVWAQAPEGGGVPPCPWPATDGLGRELPTPEEVGPPRTDRFVGIFYFLWHNQRDGKAPYAEGPYDVSEILAQEPEALKKPDSPLWGPIGMSHYWGEPLYGYYLSTDPWVLRRHAYLLSDAGIDVLIFDTTNAVTYPEVYRALCEVFTQVRAEGGRTPGIAFMVNTQAGETARKIHEDLYKPGLYKDLWFVWQGKPLMICDPKEASPELQAFFTLRRAHWPFEMVNTPSAWHWEAAYPQPYGYVNDASRPEQVNVSVAQNLRQADGKVTNMSNGDARGRSFHDGRMESGADAVARGYNFEEQWKRAYELDSPFVMVTGWNEWIAGRWGEPGGPVVFVDQFSQEYSRDIEPMKGGHGDNYYYQMAGHIRRYKGAPAMPKASAPKTIVLDDGFEAWADVAPAFRDHIGETAPREYDGAAGLHYANRTGRNDIVECKVARDGLHVYFYVQTREVLKPRTDSNRMQLYLNTDQDAKTGWEGFDYRVQVSGENEGVWLEKNAGGWNWKRVQSVGVRAEGNELHLAIPRKALDLFEGEVELSMDFKWADNVPADGNVMDFYVSGDTAPEGRFAYRYIALP